MKRLREIHLYLGCLFAPVLIFFAVTGAWQLFGLHRAKKNGYVPSRAVVLLSDVHQFQHLPPASPYATTPLRYFMLAGSLGLVTTTLLGVFMAFRFGRGAAPAICLLAGIVIPVVLLLIWH